MEPQILFEDASIIVINKPARLIVHSDGRTQEPTLAEWLITHDPSLAGVGAPWVSPQGESVRIAGLVHRLDRTTSGVIVAAKTDAMYVFLKGEFKARRIQKSYRALVYGSLATNAGTIVAEIMRSSTTPRYWYARACDAMHVRAAITDWELLQYVRAADVSYLALFPKTGRTHQIRVHCASIGHPIVGDHLYAPERASVLGFTRPALHAYSISWVDSTGTRVTYVAPLAPDFPLDLLQS